MREYLSLINLQEISDSSNSLYYVVTQRHHSGFWSLCTGALQAETTEVQFIATSVLKRKGGCI